MSKTTCGQCFNDVCITVRDIWELCSDGVVLYVFSYDGTAKYFYAAGIKGVGIDRRSKFYNYFDFEALSICPCDDDFIYVQIPHVKNSIYDN